MATQIIPGAFRETNNPLLLKVSAFYYFLFTKVL